MSYYVYLDRTNSGIVFYVGLTSGKARLRRMYRNKEHKKICIEYGLNRTFVVFEDRELAISEEIRLIKEHNTNYYNHYPVNVFATNLNNGGALPKTQRSVSSKNRTSKSLTGKKLSKSTKTKIGSFSKGKTNKERIDCCDDISHVEFLSEVGQF